MYNLIMSGDPDAWKGRRTSLSVSRLCEHTAESLKARYQRLDDEAIRELTSLPTLFAYEKVHALPARLGRVTRIVRPSGGDLRFEYSFDEEVDPIPAEKLLELAWELDINDQEMYRTHWAIKDVDLHQILREQGLIGAERDVAASKAGASGVERAPEELSVAPTVFAVPSVERDPRLVSVMMPFDVAFNPVYTAIREAVQDSGYNCQRADDIWEEPTIIQDVFNLIYRSAVVVVDLSARNSNVMYETGIAHTLGRPVVPIAQTLDGIPLDLAHHRVLAYLPNRQGLTELQNRLAAKLRRYNGV